MHSEWSADRIPELPIFQPILLGEDFDPLLETAANNRYPKA
ncbi:hypothetical protein ACPOL_6185 [Acidisarcina polymorpha]|uniref:Uncharacterized protein n=1 Tax=Acidisarcina polymorpha TaxID=2211140 RepID=A0A2Z5G8W1_9BACT|nr:hypothetical protein ACPOL_6185 [Acidisarcina polymorpha]